MLTASVHFPSFSTLERENSLFCCSVLLFSTEKMSALPNIELLKRHKASRDAGIITEEQFMEIYHGIINESVNINQVSLPSNLSSSSSSSSSSLSKPPTPRVPKNILLSLKTTIQNQPINSLSALQKSPVISFVSEDSGPDNKVHIYEINTM
jgi:hypothetical protein